MVSAGTCNYGNRHQSTCRLHLHTHIVKVSMMNLYMHVVLTGIGTNGPDLSKVQKYMSCRPASYCILHYLISDALLAATDWLGAHIITLTSAIWPSTHYPSMTLVQTLTTWILRQLLLDMGRKLQESRLHGMFENCQPPHKVYGRTCNDLDWVATIMAVV